MKKINAAEMNNYTGKRVNAKQLEDICDIYMIISEVEFTEDDIGDGDVTGILDVFSKEPLKLSKDNSALIYHSSFERGEYCDYE